MRHSRDNSRAPAARVVVMRDIDDVGRRQRRNRRCLQRDAHVSDHSAYRRFDAGARFGFAGREPRLHGRRGCAPQLHTQHHHGDGQCNPAVQPTRTIMDAARTAGLHPMCCIMMNRYENEPYGDEQEHSGEYAEQDAAGYETR